ncbi:glycosyltransferase family 2 protein [Geofilum sp. OHC36d9]|uniref:glycosyltransferase family 2 protein n=1 Tax=Geofilum sp. OHC36d9 TaxID=3458413 RepID=UPI00403414B0
MNCDCLNSLSRSESNFKFNVVIMESNKNFHNSNLKYPKLKNISLTILIPDEPFNYNKFLNIGIKHTKNELIAFCNNDLLFKPNWLTEINNVIKNHPKAYSFCPLNPLSNWTPPEKFKTPQLGYKVRIEFVGWCYVVKRLIFQKIPLHDENFDFFFQDDDFALTLKKYAIENWLVPKSHVIHLGGETTSITDGYKYNQRAVGDNIRFHKKWGSPRTIALKDRLLKYIFKPLGLEMLSKYIY